MGSTTSCRTITSISSAPNTRICRICGKMLTSSLRYGPLAPPYFPLSLLHDSLLPSRQEYPPLTRNKGRRPNNRVSLNRHLRHKQAAPEQADLALVPSLGPQAVRLRLRARQPEQDRGGQLALHEGPHVAARCAAGGDGRGSREAHWSR